eukprot:CAMPEP_0179485712 /NCGR_PEP_ID=MMETSP0799-20121207/62234_1 /TAXON_ID=46947 /ORGANISM="Geminigera cryophila, Strain CCMP2564" /LENGTH=370 /DNA_ID=CAMNT_0021300181 /DNA_START=258 /DNA_END=1366 /DNA_ORIENTATION=-
MLSDMGKEIWKCCQSWILTQLSLALPSSTMAEKEHLSVVICGHVDSGKSTTTGRLLFELGGIPERELEKLKEEAANLGKSSFAFAFYMDRQKEERERGVTIACTTKEFFTDKWHYTKEFFTDKWHYTKEFFTDKWHYTKEFFTDKWHYTKEFFTDKWHYTKEFFTDKWHYTKEFFTDKWHYTIIDAPGHRDFIKNMISGAAQADVALLMVPADGNFTTAIQKGDAKAGETQGQPRQHARILNLLGVRQLIIGINKMDCDVAGYKEERYNEIRDEMRNMLIRVGWKKDFVAKSVPVLPISGWMGDNLLEKSKNMPWWNGVDIVVESTGRLQGCQGKVFTVEMHHKRVDAAKPGDNVGMNIKGLDKNNMPRS